MSRSCTTQWTFVAPHLRLAAMLSALGPALATRRARTFVKLAENSKLLPAPSPFMRFWRSSHPPLAERIASCRDYHSW